MKLEGLTGAAERNSKVAAKVAQLECDDLPLENVALEAPDDPSLENVLEALAIDDQPLEDR